MAIYDDYKRRKVSNFKLIPDWLSNLWDNLWWNKKTSELEFGGEYYIGKTFKTGNLALLIAIGTLISFLIHI